MGRSQTLGFTLVELMVTIAILVILIMIGMPNFQGVIRSNRVATYTNELLAAIALTRSEAMRSRHGATMCAANEAGSGCGDATDWGRTGWLIWVNNNATPGLDAGDVLVRVQQPDPNIALDSNTGSIAFDGRGRPRGAGYGLLVRPSDCPDGENHARNIEVNASGQTKMRDQSCAE